MNFYRIRFENNRAVSATEVPSIHSGSAALEVVNGKRVLKNLTVMAVDEIEGLFIADRIFRNYLSFLGSQKE